MVERCWHPVDITLKTTNASRTVWWPVPDTDPLKVKLQRHPSSGRFYITSRCVYFENKEDALWFKLSKHAE